MTLAFNKEKQTPWGALLEKKKGEGLDPRCGKCKRVKNAGDLQAEGGDMGEGRKGVGTLH